MCLGGFGSILAGIALIDVSQLHFLDADCLYGLRQLADLIPVLGIGRGDMQRQQMSQGIHGSVNFRPFTAWHRRSRPGHHSLASITRSGCR